jgi:RNA polymerase sigma-70 factor (ECF subfamily)
MATTHDAMRTAITVTAVIDPDEDVVCLVGRGDVTRALQALMQRHGASVYRYCRVALRDAALADDVQQQVFLQAFRDLSKFGGRSTVRVWLFGIARHRVLDAVRSRSRAHVLLDHAELPDLADPRPGLDQSLDDVRLREALVASLGELGHHSRTAVLLRYQQGFSFEEMAEICNEKPGTLQARVARALPRLRARILAHITDERLES